MGYHELQPVKGRSVSLQGFTPKLVKSKIFQATDSTAVNFAEFHVRFCHHGRVSQQLAQGGCSSGGMALRFAGYFGL
jgi:hypothetical protein